MNRFVILIALLAQHCAGASEVSKLKADEQVVFHPTFAQRVLGREIWRAEVRGFIFEPEKAPVSVAVLREALELKTGDLTPAESKIFTERARLFLVDHERGKKIFIRLGTNEFYVGKSAKDGTFSGRIEFPTESATTFSAILPPGDQRQFKGQIFPLDAEGLSVISDIDDTIKITEVRDRQATLRNTFLREFQPAPGMAQFYQTLARSNHAAFHYVSASPWQLYEPLSKFGRSNSFPAGTFHLKPFRWKDRSFLSLFGDPVKYKLSVIEPILKQFPKRQFILIGDSGERDPEIYGELARRHPKQITRIYIRNVTSESGDAPRYAEAFRKLPIEKWQVFESSVNLP